MFETKGLTPPPKKIAAPSLKTEKNNKKNLNNFNLSG